MTSPRRRMLLTILLFAGVLSIGPFISPIPEVDVVTIAEFETSEAAAIGSHNGDAADILGGERYDATGVPEPAARSGHRLLFVALVTVVLGIALAAVARPVERGPVRLRRPAAGLLPDRRGPPLFSV